MTVLLLAGTGEAVRIAGACHVKGIPTIASLAGATRNPAALSVPTRHGGFGGDAGFEAFLSAEKITTVMDATHPYAHRISQRTARICAQRGIPYCQFLRPPWTPEPQDRWTELASEAEAAEHIEPGACVFLATGRQTLDKFAGLSECRLICRQIDPPEGPFPFPNGRFLVGRPPFTVQDEAELFAKLGVDWLVVKNAGGAASFTKLIAARLLGLRVAMIARPAQPSGPKVQTIDDAVNWIMAQ
ncbi:MAG: cobalt-precorrin-6A reductase [Roseovarius sp.]